MQFNDSRRDFLTGTSKATAAAAIVTSVPAFARDAFADVGAADTVDRVLFALGNRIGAEVGTMIGSFGTPLSVTYMDAAGASVDALRDGIESGARTSVGCGAVCVEAHLPYGQSLGTAFFKDPISGATARVDIHPEALSHVEMISGVASAERATQALNAVPSSGLYSVSVSSQLMFS